jgi:alkylation response protein AidB-like acyl-CoA dehydrogenase
MFDLTDDQRAIEDTVRQFAADHMAPHAADWDVNHTFPRDVLKKAAELGLAAIYVKEDVGGSNLGRMESVVVFEALSRGCPSTAAFLSIHNMASWMIDCFGDQDQRQRLLPEMTRLDVIASYCLTEPSAGSDAAALRTKASRDGDHYVLNGTKAFISGGGASDRYVVMARTGGEGAGGISCFVVDKGTPGLSFGANERKMGWHSQPTSMVHFDNVRVPAINRIGEEGQGFRFAMAGLDGGRLNIGACSLGPASIALELARDYMKTRQAFGRAIAGFQGLQFKLADMATELEAARLMIRHAAAKLDQKAADATMHCAMAKRFATDTGFRVVNDALQIFGGYGYLCDYPLERLLRDTRVHQILEGTNEIMRVITARALLKAD